MSWADAAGILRVTASDNPASVPLDVSDRQYFREAAKTLRPVVGDAIVTRVTPLPTLIIAVPVLNTAGSLTGMIPR